jgi:hypothetical protein
MAKRFVLAIAVALVCLYSPFALTQNEKTEKTANEPSRYVWYEVAKVAPGKYEQFNKINAQYRETAATAAPDAYWVAGSPFTGDSDLVTFVTFHDNMASVDKMMTAFDKLDEALVAKNASFAAQAAETEAGSHFVLAEYNKELSYRPEMVPISHTAWWTASMFNLKPGCEYEFKDVVKQVQELDKRTGYDDHWIAYEIRAGAPEPSVLFVTPLRSLADLDKEPPAAAKEAFDSAPMRQMFQKIGKECIAHIESTYTKVNPQLSRMPQAVIAANPDFWTIKEAAPAVATKKGKPKKEGAVVPAAIKEPEKK